MTTALAEDRQVYVDSVIEFAKQHLADDVDRDASGEFYLEGWQKCAEFGIHGLPFPARYGGLDADRLTTIMTMEGLGYGCHDSGLIFSISAHMWACQLPIWRFGTEEQKERYLPGLIRGTLIAAHGASEPDSGSDVHSMRTAAVRKGGLYILNGTKTFVTNAPIADLAVVFANVDRGKGLGGITAFLIDKDTPGFSVSRGIAKMGLRTSPMAELILDDCEIPVESVLGQEGGGPAIFNCSMEWERGSILASQVGTMRRQLENCVSHAKVRRQFGKPIGKFQQVSARIADMKIRLETSRALLYKMAASDSRGTERLMEAAVAKAYISECAVQSGLDAIQIHGGYGYAVESGIERDLRDAIGGTIYSGTTEIQKNIIARGLGL